MTAAGVLAGAAGGFALARIAGSYIQNVRLPGALPVLASAAVLLLAAVSDRFCPRPAPRASTSCRRSGGIVKLGIGIWNLEFAFTRVRHIR